MRTPAPRSVGERRRANRAGRWAETLAVAWLMLKRYRILARGYRVAGGEIDIVARQGTTIAFVEVKARGSAEAALLAVDGAKRRRIARAAAVWLSHNPWAVGATFRGDAVLVVPRRWPRHVADAFPVGIGW